MRTGLLVRLRRRVVKQSQRLLSLYVGCCALVVLIISQISSPVVAPQQPEILKRGLGSHPKTVTEGDFPRKIWQSWKVDALDFEERDLLNARSWVSKNPGYRYEVLTDGNDLQYVETHFGPSGLNRSDIVYVYQSLTTRIIKADLLRYLVMYIEGGVYVDIDVEALKPLDRFIPDTRHFEEKDIDMIIGVEIDQPEFSDHPILGPKSKSFCQWTFISKPRLPVMLSLVDRIIAWLIDISDKQGVPISDVNLSFDDVISGTGPSAFTQVILDAMSLREGRQVTWDYFHNLDESRLVGGILVLTVEAFAAGQGHSDSGDHNSRHALVKHHYHASGWPNLHPRYTHPIYGPVEACNWEPVCVQLWDFHTAAFAKLPPEEQARQIDAKTILDQQSEDDLSPQVVPESPDPQIQLQRRHLPENPVATFGPIVSHVTVVSPASAIAAVGIEKSLSMVPTVRIIKSYSGKPSLTVTQTVKPEAISKHSAQPSLVSIQTVKPSVTMAVQNTVSGFPSYTVSSLKVAHSSFITVYTKKGIHDG